MIAIKYHVQRSVELVEDGRELGLHTPAEAGREVADRVHAGAGDKRPRKEYINFRSTYCDEPCSLSFAMKEVGESTQGL